MTCGSSSLNASVGPLRGARDDLSWDEVTALARSVLHEYTRHYAPKVAVLIEAGDFNAAVAAFMATLRTGQS